MDSFDAEVFLSFATDCYGPGHKIQPDSTLSQLIKAQLAEHLAELIECDAVAQINDIGGTPNKQLVEVFMESYKADRAAQAAAQLQVSMKQAEELVQQANEVLEPEKSSPEACSVEQVLDIDTQRRQSDGF